MYQTYCRGYASYFMFLHAQGKPYIWFRIYTNYHSLEYFPFVPPNLWSLRDFAVSSAQPICHLVQIRNTNFSLSRSESLGIALAFPQTLCSWFLKVNEATFMWTLNLFSTWSHVHFCLCTSVVISTLGTNQAINGASKILIQATSNSTSNYGCFSS